LTLLDVPPGCRARVTGFQDGFPADRRAYLQAYGLTPHDWVTVLQNSPVTVIRLENTELALESELADGIQVEQIRRTDSDEDCQ
jgi:Fe2+ transport system protein FeoA